MLQKKCDEPMRTTAISTTMNLLSTRFVLILFNLALYIFHRVTHTLAHLMHMIQIMHEHTCVISS